MEITNLEVSIKLNIIEKSVEDFEQDKDKIENFITDISEHLSLNAYGEELTDEENEALRKGIDNKMNDGREPDFSLKRMVGNHNSGVIKTGYYNVGYNEDTDMFLFTLSGIKIG